MISDHNSLIVTVLRSQLVNDNVEKKLYQDYNLFNVKCSVLQHFDYSKRISGGVYQAAAGSMLLGWMRKYCETF